MKAPIKIGLQARTTALYIERYANEYWKIPISTDPKHEFGTFLLLYDNGKVINITYRPDGDHSEFIVKPEDK